MQIQRVWVLRGPNHWARFPVLEAEIDLEGLSLQLDEGFRSRLAKLFPLARPLPIATSLLEFLGRTALQLHKPEWYSVHFTTIKPMTAEGKHRRCPVRGGNLGQASLSRLRSLPRGHFDNPLICPPS